jgi:transposase
VGRRREPAQNHLVFAGIEVAPLPGYSPDLMPVEALWRWLRENVTYHHCHATADDLTRRVATFEAQVN